MKIQQFKFTIISLILLSIPVFAFAYVLMNKAPTGRTFGDQSTSWEYSTSVSSVPANLPPAVSIPSDWILIPGSVGNVSVTVVPSTGTSAIVQTTTDLMTTIQSTQTVANATAYNWSAGTVTVTMQDSSRPVTAMRVILLSSGTVTLTLRAQ